MRKPIITGVGVLAAALLTLLPGGTAGATPPAPTVGGLKFEGNDLIHHAAPAPDQPSFFSVEVYGTDGGYATLRWDVPTSKWVMVTGGQLYTDASPAALVDLVTPHKSHHVVSFGVGYTNSPPGTVPTVVDKVTFGGQDYHLDCKPPVVHPSHSHPSPSRTTASPTASPTRTSASPTASPIGQPQPTTPGRLAQTGFDSATGFSIGGAMVLAGVIGIAASRFRRRRRFEA